MRMLEKIKDKLFGCMHEYECQEVRHYNYNPVRLDEAPKATHIFKCLKCRQRAEKNTWEKGTDVGFFDNIKTRSRCI